MRELIYRFRPFFVHAALFSLVLNLLLLAPMLYMMQIFDRVISSRSEETLVMLTFAVLIALVMNTALETMRARLLHASGVALDRKLGPRVLDGVLEHTARLSRAEYLNGLRDVSTLRNFLTGNGIFALFDAPWLPLFLLLIYLFHPLLGVVATFGACTMVFLAYLNERTTRPSHLRLKEKTQKASRFVDASVRNAEVVSALGMLPAVTRRWQSLNDAVLREQVEGNATGRTINGFTRFTRQVIQISMVGTGAWLVVDQHVTPGVMLAATLILGRALAPVELIVGGWKSMIEARVAWQHLDQLLATQADVVEPTELPVPLGALSAERLMFGLKGAEKPIIRGVSFALPAGEALGIIGPSAAGKSTLARLIVGVWKPNSGAMRMDGADVATWAREQLGPHIGYLPQDVELFAGTVAENIARMGEVDSPAVIQAAQMARVHELILRLPQGYDTEVGDSGNALSPGQRQRIALARALYGNPRMVLLDEPNANLDREGEEALLHALSELKQAGVTTVLIAHRPSLLSGVDKILVMRDGVVEMFGTRAEIMARVTRGAPPARGVA